MERNGYILRVLRAPDEHRKVLYRDDNGTGFSDNGDGTWTDENGNTYTE